MDLRIGPKIGVDFRKARCATEKLERFRVSAKTETLYGDQMKPHLLLVEPMMAEIEARLCAASIVNGSFEGGVILLRCSIGSVLPLVHHGRGGRGGVSGPARPQPGRAGGSA